MHVAKSTCYSDTINVTVRYALKTLDVNSFLQISGGIMLWSLQKDPMQMHCSLVWNSCTLADRLRLKPVTRKKLQFKLILKEYNSAQKV